MSYLVLARKWRPRRFAELVGQEHVVRALSNALDSGRVHHAFLFTGTRGVGKTTIARIFAKSLNCERGVGAEPCGVCAVCEAVDAGRFVDLLEIDAASNTGVDDVREVIENAQYLPTRGRYKVYLVDEVHMLSRNAFNALLKTLEEPPEHVKFLLATTDPQKLPVTVLSRCLQFNLKRLTEEQIAGQMRHILDAERVDADAGSIALLARGADGSLRDGLSLLDQALAFGAGSLREADVRSMLGTVERSQVDALLQALAAGDGATLMQECDRVAAFAPDFGSALDEVAQTLHRVQLLQLVPGYDVGEERGALATLATSIAPDLVQLWYQMAISGRRDLGLAPSPRVGFEMALLRMLAFRPAGGEAPRPSSSPEGGLQTPRSTPIPHSAAADTAVATDTASRLPRAPESAPVATASGALPEAGAARPGEVRRRGPADGGDWLDLLAHLGLRGPVRELAANSAFVSYAPGLLRLALPEALEHLRSEPLVRSLAQTVGESLGEHLRIEFGARREESGETLHDRQRREREQRQTDAEAAFLHDPAVQRMVGRYGARVQTDSIRPLDDPA